MCPPNNTGTPGFSDLPTALNKHVVSDNELSLNHENKLKKLNIEQSEVRIVVFNSSENVTPKEKRDDYQNYSVVSSIKEVKKPDTPVTPKEKRVNCQNSSIVFSMKEIQTQSDVVHETPIPVIPEDIPKIRQRKQKISVRNEVALEKDQQISIIANREYFSSHAIASLESKTNSISRINDKILQKKRSFQCPKCNFKTKNQHNFNLHIKSKRSHLQRKQRIRQSSLKCPDCNFEATGQHQLDVHIKGKEKNCPVHL